MGSDDNPGVLPGKEFKNKSGFMDPSLEHPPSSRSLAGLTQGGAALLKLFTSSVGRLFSSSRRKVFLSAGKLTQKRFRAVLRFMTSL